MEKSLAKILEGYQKFRKKYVLGHLKTMKYLSSHGQHPKTMVVACCDSRVDPALLLQCDPGDLFVVRNIANIVPPYEKSGLHSSASAALEYGICHLNVKHLIILGHSGCGGIQNLLDADLAHKSEFISRWMDLIRTNNMTQYALDKDKYAQLALTISHQNCLTFPWINEKIQNKQLAIWLWFFDIKNGIILSYSHENHDFQPLT